MAAFSFTLGAGTVTTGDLANQAVTAAKIANGTITDTQVSANGLSSASLNPNTIQYQKSTVTAAQFKAMYATPLLVLAAPAAGSAYVVEAMVLAMTFVTTAYAAGGNVALEYGSGAHLANETATALITAATVDAWAASSAIKAGGVMASTASTNVVATGLYLSNDTTAFTTGDGTFDVHLWYHTVVL